jgi:hypothetical protein
MGAIASFFSWLFGASVQRMEKVYVYARNREASGGELLAVLNDPRLKPIFDSLIDKNSRYAASTEEWRFERGETESTAMARVAAEVSRRHPGKTVHYLAWPDDELVLIVLIVTAPHLELPLAQAEAALGTPIKIIEGADADRHS